jgi:hypothetical protein
MSVRRSLAPPLHHDKPVGYRTSATASGVLLTRISQLLAAVRFLNHRGLFVTETHMTPEKLRDRAVTLRVLASHAALPGYAEKLRDAAWDLETEAQRLTEIRLVA